MNSLVTIKPGFDTSKYYLGEPCPKGHRFAGSEFSVRYVKRRRCVECVCGGSQPYLDQSETYVEKVLLKGLEHPQYYLGLLCRKKHDYCGKGQSLRYRLVDGKNKGGCVQCAKIRSAAFRDAKNSKLKEQKEAQKQQQEAHKQLVAAAGFDPNIFRLGKLCIGSHEWQDTGMTLFRKYTCQDCAKKFRAKNREKLNRRQREAHDPVKARQEMQKWLAKPGVKEAVRFKQTIGRHRKRALNFGCVYEEITLEQWNGHLQQFNNCCAYCEQASDLTVDHLVNLRNGGSHTLNNMLPACRSCNSSKGVLDAFSWYSQEDCWSLTRWQRILKVLGRDA